MEGGKHHVYTWFIHDSYLLVNRTNTPAIEVLPQRVLRRTVQVTSCEASILPTLEHRRRKLTSIPMLVLHPLDELTRFEPCVIRSLQTLIT